MPRLRRSVPLLTLLVAAGAALAGCGVPAPAGTEVAARIPDGAFDTVLTLVLERLDTAPRVAASKYFSGQPVTDAAREKVVLDTAAAAAGEAGADVDQVTAVFADQIAASKEVQVSLLDGWRADPSTAPASAPDLATEVRPVLDRITTELVPALAEVQRYRDDPQCARVLGAAAAASAPSTAQVAAALPTALAHVCG
jgi:chorismate mutase